MAGPSHACPVCGGGCTLFGTKHSVFHGRDYDHLRCTRCGHMHVYPFPGYEIYDERYYRGEGPDPFVDYESEYRDHRSTDRLMEFDDLFRIVERELLAAPPASGPVRWLDYGCGAGGFLKYLRERGTIAGRPIEVAGFDIGAYAERLRSVDGMHILELPELETPEPVFDVVSVIEVLEHIREVDATFRALATKLAPGGVLLATTGNLNSFAARRAGINYRYLIPEVHISLYNPDALRLLYARHGLEPLEVRYLGVVRFKVIKSLRHPVLKALAAVALRLPGITRAIDALYGVSAMPCARKPGP
ncbi:class I SAM-dependent methyltransferase [Nibricoccus sp. IMCC34717]|uniref:class I SAM-dependent methyltransferase n=1 Tax=Nibricoccus sp. IMCC34717 TaxID=3034021 RepID=UPI003850578A